ncbi:MAG: NAD(P)/FAD-dependent oxidoreductase [Proteobacteria bacterium]|nr:NAD(P)/FAD-dependent oxidoreductase [Pseudomonadota bacterium]
MTDANQVVVIGGGHNGLVCAAYLAKAGRTVTLLEAADTVGGAAVTREFAPGFRVSACAHLLNLLDAGIRSELALDANGLEFARADLQTIALADDGDHLTISGDSVSGAAVSEADQTALVEYRRRMDRFARLLGRLHKRPPPRLGVNNSGDLLSIARLGLNIRRLGKTDMNEFLRIAGINIYDVLEENFEHPLLKGALSLDGVLGAHLGPRSNNSVLNALYRTSGDPGSMALPRGGMGAVTSALGAAAKRNGVSIRTSSRVKRIQIDGDRIQGVELDNGEQIAAAAVVSNADPRTTFFGLLGARHLEAEFVRRIDNIRMNGNAAKLHLALDRLPEFTGLAQDKAGERLLIAPDVTYVERAFDHSKYGRYSTEPALEITIPSVHDDSLAPSGQHVLSAVVQYAPYALKEGWETGKQAFLDQLIDLIGRYAPDLRQRVVASELLTPVDIEREFGMTGGHWHHGEYALDQAFMLRPVPGAAQYTTPINGLFLCGAGCHPGGGVMGNAGRNAAAVVLGQGKAA